MRVPQHLTACEHIGHDFRVGLFQFGFQSRDFGLCLFQLRDQQMALACRGENDVDHATKPGVFENPKVCQNPGAAAAKTRKVKSLTPTLAETLFFLSYSRVCENKQNGLRSERETPVHGLLSFAQKKSCAARGAGRGEREPQIHRVSTEHGFHVRNSRRLRRCDGRG